MALDQDRSVLCLRNRLGSKLRSDEIGSETTESQEAALVVLLHAGQNDIPQ